MYVCNGGWVGGGDGWMGIRSKLWQVPVSKHHDSLIPLTLFSLIAFTSSTSYIANAGGGGLECHRRTPSTSNSAYPFLYVKVWKG